MGARISTAHSAPNRIEVVISDTRQPPLLPGWTDAVIWITWRSLPGPMVALTAPVVTLTLCRALFHGKANDRGGHSDRKQNPVELHRGRR